MKSLLLLALPCAALAAEFWDQKEPAQWSAKEVERLLNRSPWAKQATPSMDFSRMPQGGPPGGPPGGMPPGGPPGGMPPGGMPGGGPPGAMPGGMPEMKATVRWESAKPVRDASKTALPTETIAAYVLSISGIPAMGNGPRPGADPAQMTESLKAGSSLNVKSKDPLHPFRVQMDRESGAILFFFAKDAALIDTSTKEITFSAQLGPLEFKAKFLTKEMKYKGQSAF